MIRAVLDTNVLVSAVTGFLIPQSVPGQLLHAWLAGLFELITSEHILTEVRRTLQKTYFQARLTPGQIARFQLLLEEEATIAPLTVMVRGVATHPEDDLVLSTALSAQADYLVTGDGRLRDLDTYQGVTTLSPRAFLELLRDS